jgi:hypothetical protein
MATNWTVVHSGQRITELNWNSTLEDIEITLYDTENNIEVQMQYRPERDITVYESTKLNIMFLGIMAGGLEDKKIIYIRKHNLERHFRFSVVK